MPILTADMSAGTLVAWRKQPGDTVARGDIIALVETDKGLIDIEVYATGVIERFLVEPGATVPTGTVLAIIRDGATATRPTAPSSSEAVAAQAAVPGAATPGSISVSERGVAIPAEAAPAPPTPAAPRPAPDMAPPSDGVAPAAPSGAGARLKVTPLARKRAAELGIDVATVKGTGPGGVIRREDVEQATAAAAPAPLGARPAAERSARLRKAIAAAMARSKREIPHYYLATTIDMQAALAWLAEENLRRTVDDRLLYGVLLIKAVALALREVPELNSVWQDGEAIRSEAIHVGVAISLRGGGLVAPALRDADHQGLDDLMRGFRDLVRRARTGGLRSGELSDPTITITSLGEQGVESVFGVIFPPQVAIVGFGAIVERPWVVAGHLAAHRVITATLSADHRVSDGHRGGLFLAAVDRLLQEPARL
jgi:pyruvate dehydrogenase E2 component (dihydrolipoamide acetyltransferase)